MRQKKLESFLNETFPRNLEQDINSMREEQKRDILRKVMGYFNGTLPPPEPSDDYPKFLIWIDPEFNEVCRFTRLYFQH